MDESEIIEALRHLKPDAQRRILGAAEPQDTAFSAEAERVLTYHASRRAKRVTNLPYVGTAGPKPTPEQVEADQRGQVMAQRGFVRENPKTGRSVPPSVVVTRPSRKVPTPQAKVPTVQGGR